MKATPMSKAELERAEQMLNDGASYCAIGRALGRTDGTIAKYFPGRGWRPGNPGMRPDELKRAEQMLDDGASYHDVAKTLGRHPTTISARFPGRGWPTSRGHEMRKFNAGVKAARL